VDTFVANAATMAGHDSRVVSEALSSNLFI